jgi:plasmid stabilization system protein ParE
MGYKVILSPQAIRDVERIVRRIAKEDPSPPKESATRCLIA